MTPATTITANTNTAAAVSTSVTAAASAVDSANSKSSADKPVTVAKPVAAIQSWEDLKEMIEKNAQEDIRLPALGGLGKYNPAVPLDIAVESFIKSPNKLASALQSIDTWAKRIVKNPDDANFAIANHFVKFFNYTSTQKFLVLESINAALNQTGNSSEVIENFNVTTQLLMKRLCQRLDWILDLQDKAYEDGSLYPLFYMQVVAKDAAWMNETADIVRLIEEKERVLRKQNNDLVEEVATSKIEQKTAKDKSNHSTEVDKDVERAGFVFCPMKSEIDRAMCPKCKVIVAGFRAWHCPRTMHDWSKHPASEMPKATDPCW